MELLLALRAALMALPGECPKTQMRLPFGPLQALAT